MDLLPEDYKKIKEEAKELYRTIGQIWCPQLNDHIFFNKKGFDHFLWKGKKYRPRADQVYRFSLIKYASGIISDPSAAITHSLWKKYTSPTSSTQFWAFAGNTNGKHIRLIVRQVGNGRKHFFSIFPESEK